MFPDPFAALKLPALFPQADGLPIGVILPFAGAMTTPFQANAQINNSGVWLRNGGWLLCDGTELNILEFTDLFVVLGKVYGGDGEKTFCLPDYRGYFLRGDGRTENPADSVDKSLDERVDVQGNAYDGVGSIEADSLQDHTHWSELVSATGVDAPTIATGKEGAINEAKTESSTAIEPGTLDPTTGQATPARLSEETRPVNLSVSYLIKAAASGPTHTF